MTIKKTIFLLALSAVGFTACKKDKIEEEPVQPDFEQVTKYIKKYKSGVIEFSKYPVDSVDITAKGFFNFDKMAFISPDKVKTSEWDMVIDNGYATVIYPNNGVSAEEESAWFGNSSRIMVNHVLKSFDDVDAVPADLVFGNDRNVNAIGVGEKGTEPYLSTPVYWGYFAYDIDGNATHVVPFTGRTSIFKLADGRYVKFQMINTYNNEPDKNSATSKWGFCSFRYFISKAGSTDIKTK